jgi:hypothetical protein
VGELRIGTRERELAMSALDEHLSEGRLDPGEYAERSATASTARFRSELDELFTDLPEPHPAYPGVRAEPVPGSGTTTTGASPTTTAPGGSERVDDLPELAAPLGARLGRHAGMLSALVPVVVVALFVLTEFRFPQVFLLIPVAIALLGWLGHRHGG